MSTIQDVLARVAAQTTVIESVRQLIEELRAAAPNPLELKAIVEGLDANTAALSVLANTPSEEPPVEEPPVEEPPVEEPPL